MRSAIARRRFRAAEDRHLSEALQEGLCSTPFD
jgi:hypothetical protein